jgi:hypothetical protein
MTYFDSHARLKRIFWPKEKLAFFLALLLGVAAFSPLPALAAANECDLSLSPEDAGACPANAIGAASPNPSWLGATVEPKTDARSAIDAFGYCRYVGNVGETPVFVPFGGEDEWRGYITNRPRATVYLINCARGGSLPVPPNFGHDAETNQCYSAPPAQFVTAPYQPANAYDDFTTPTLTFSCRSIDGTEFTETATAIMKAHDSGYGPGSEIGWKIDKVLYVYDGMCGSAKGRATPTAPMAPKADLCHVGMTTPLIGTGPWTWVCKGGNGGGKNVTCSSSTSCDIRQVEEKPCRCEDGHCYRPVYWSDTCEHSWIDKSHSCETAEPPFGFEGASNENER